MTADELWRDQIGDGTRCTCGHTLGAHAPGTSVCQEPDCLGIRCMNDCSASERLAVLASGADGAC